jgi:hypothetical protein
MKNDKKPLLSIYTPTHYSEAKHYASLMNLISIAEQFKEIEVIISDNSGDLYKEGFLKKFDRENVKIVNGPDEGNYNFALHSTSGKYVLACGDDDFVLAGGIGQILDQIQTDHIANITPIGYTGIYCNKHRNFNDLFKVDLSSDLLTDRIEKYTSLIPKGNSIFHTIFNRQVAIDGFEFWHSIPNQQVYQDQLLTLFFSCKNSFSYINSTYFIYDSSNWLNRDAMIKNEIRYAVNAFKEGYIPISYVLLQRLELAVTGFFLIQSNKFNSPQDDKFQASVTWFNNWMHFWRQSLSWGYEKIDEVNQCPLWPDVLSLSEKYRHPGPVQPEEILNELSCILEKFNGSKEVYLNFWKNI